MKKVEHENDLVLPKHIGIIMDGNGRWAQSKFRNRTFGHIKGARIARQIISSSSDKGIQFVTLYAFSSENWKRPTDEIQLLMRLLKRYLKREVHHLMNRNIKFSAIGELNRLPLDVIEIINNVVLATQNNSGMHLVFAISYGSRGELVQATKKIAELCLQGKMKVEEVNEQTIQNNLMTNEIPDPDFIIRTSGEKRLSNFLLWQSAYSELYFTTVFWPDFSLRHFDEALIEYSQRERRFGSVAKA